MTPLESGLRPAWTAPCKVPPSLKRGIAQTPVSRAMEDIFRNCVRCNSPMYREVYEDQLGTQGAVHGPALSDVQHRRSRDPGQSARAY
jgi:hypothetical protein